jgi:hypothetical protein
MIVKVAEKDYTKGWWADEKCVWLELHTLTSETITTLSAYGLFLIVQPVGQQLDYLRGRLVASPGTDVYCCGISITAEPLREEFRTLRNKLDLLGVPDLATFLDSLIKIYPPHSDGDSLV